ncbi:PREDICTED: FUN14 domain-containing protein 2-like [Lipotes vexillifer]|uniref:FUN14 domain-containing protein 2 n=1 Tax=Lipotes vexillifer TaxID=118797 RepID=A0A340Y7E7_LIPVE|nr:PREDICTED: FUN14 domain-containing protein 2-like [Lipotes vexillifer]
MGTELGLKGDTHKEEAFTILGSRHLAGGGRVLIEDKERDINPNGALRRLTGKGDVQTEDYTNQDRRRGNGNTSPRAGSQLAPMAARHSASYRAEARRVSPRDELAEMAAASQGNLEVNFESLDLAELAKKQPGWCKLSGQESGPSAEKYSLATQLLIGGATGWCTGFIFQKVERLAATALGGGFFLLRLAKHTGYIKVDGQRVERDMKKAKEQLKIRKSNQIPTEVKSKLEEVGSFVKKNVLVTGGFFRGFLLGMAS